MARWLLSHTNLTTEGIGSALLLSKPSSGKLYTKARPGRRKDGQRYDKRSQGSTEPDPLREQREDSGYAMESFHLRNHPVSFV